MSDDPRSVLKDRPRGGWPYLWLGWIGLFFVIEGFALFNDKGGDTLTENFQYVVGTAGWGWGLAAFGLLFAWLLPHFFGPDSRVWKYDKLRRMSRTDEGAPKRPVEDVDDADSE